MFDKSLIPPVIRMLMEEDWGELNSFDDFTKKYKHISDEVADQAEWSSEHFEYFDDLTPKTGALVITASGGLNPFSRDICSSQACRINTAQQISRTLGLYADIMLVGDPFSYWLAGNRKPTVEHLRRIFIQMLVLRELYPLIEVGAIRFWSGKMALCGGCSQTMNSRIDNAVLELTEELERYIRVETKNDHLFVKMTGLMESSNNCFMYILNASDKKEIKSGSSIKDLAIKLYTGTVKEKVRSTLLALSFAQKTSSMLFSTSRSELYALKSFDEDAPSLSKLAVWEKARSIQLPWVSKMSSSQIVELRELAAKALPSFRGTFVRHIASPRATIESTSDKIEELRESALDVERELKTLNPTGERNFRVITGTLGITASVYGFAAGFADPAVALGGLMSLLGLIHSSGRHEEQQVEQLQSQPGFVLLKAKELAEHAE